MKSVVSNTVTALQQVSNNRLSIFHSFILPFIFFPISSIPRRQTARPRYSLSMRDSILFFKSIGFIRNLSRWKI
ncbi:hypothetical protein V6Z12_D10G233000 [Gossypium hirsutum]